jgi:hypothetical protein
MQGVLQGVLKVQHNAGGTTSKKKGGGATLYPILHLSLPNREGIPCTFDDEGPDEAESFL